ncbi:MULTISPECIES: hypothetical protein [Citrobacter]|nr:hypothetical protein [Citrobacter braakii]
MRVNPGAHLAAQGAYLPPGSPDTPDTLTSAPSRIPGRPVSGPDGASFF